MENYIIVKPMRKTKSHHGSPDRLNLPSATRNAVVAASLFSSNYSCIVISPWEHGFCTELILMHVSWEELRLALQCVWSDETQEKALVPLYSFSLMFLMRYLNHAKIE